MRNIKRERESKNRVMGVILMSVNRKEGKKMRKCM